MLLVEVLENPNKYYGQLSVGPRFLDGSMWPLQKAVTLSAADVALDSEAVLHAFFEAQQEEHRPDETQKYQRTIALADAAQPSWAWHPLLKVGAISRGAQYIC